MITTAIVLFPLASWVNPTYFQVGLAILNIGIVAYVATVLARGAPDNKRLQVNWGTAIQDLANSRIRIEKLVFRTINDRIDYGNDSNYRENRLDILCAGIIREKAAARAIYRLALRLDEQQISADIMYYIEDYTSWLEMIAKLFGEKKTS